MGSPMQDQRDRLRLLCARAWEVDEDTINVDANALGASHAASQARVKWENHALWREPYGRDGHAAKSSWIPILEGVRLIPQPDPNVACEEVQHLRRWLSDHEAEWVIAETQGMARKDYVWRQYRAWVLQGCDSDWSRLRRRLELCLSGKR